MSPLPSACNWERFLFSNSSDGASDPGLVISDQLAVISKGGEGE
jgi:hypothetical protein